MESIWVAFSWTRLNRHKADAAAGETAASTMAPTDYRAGGTASPTNRSAAVAATLHRWHRRTSHCRPAVTAHTPRAAAKHFRPFESSPWSAGRCRTAPEWCQSTQIATTAGRPFLAGPRISPLSPNIWTCNKSINTATANFQKSIGKRDASNYSWSYIGPRINRNGSVACSEIRWARIWLIVYLAYALHTQYAITHNSCHMQALFTCYTLCLLVTRILPCSVHLRWLSQSNNKFTERVFRRLLSERPQRNV